jgi:hypothetical protein
MNLCSTVGSFSAGIDYLHPIMKGQRHGYRDTAIVTLMANAVRLEPLNIFLYTWSFLATLEREEENRTLKKVVFPWVARFTIVIVPLAYYGLFSAWVVEDAKYYYYFNHDE